MAAWSLPTSVRPTRQVDCQTVEQAQRTRYEWCVSSQVHFQFQTVEQAQRAAEIKAKLLLNGRLMVGADAENASLSQRSAAADSHNRQFSFGHVVDPVMVQIWFSS